MAPPLSVIQTISGLLCLFCLVIQQLPPSDWVLAHLSAWHLRAQCTLLPTHSLCGPLDVKCRHVCAGSPLLVIVLFACARMPWARVLSLFGVIGVLLTCTRRTHTRRSIPDDDVRSPPLPRARSCSVGGLRVASIIVSACNAIAMSAPARMEGAADDLPEPLLTLHLASTRAAHSGLAVDPLIGTPARAAATNARTMFRSPGHLPSLPPCFSICPATHHPMHLRTDRKSVV